MLLTIIELIVEMIEIINIFTALTVLTNFNYYDEKLQFARPFLKNDDQNPKNQCS